ncbi:PAAR domain-containing protein [Sorangium sp. So ce726]|uniref:PAAR domain-containing protein n=1 Tax=Sorangium sp. So ce726 TaxID=3133319 RepID=UPI003F5E0E58
MGPAAKEGDRITAMDNHTVLLPPYEEPVDETLPFNGILDGALCATVFIDGTPAAVVGSTATNTPPHIPIGGEFAVEPSNVGEIVSGSGTVLFEGRPAARSGDQAQTCNDVFVGPTGIVDAVSTVVVGD